MVVSLEQGADLHLAQLMPLPLTVSCFSKIQIGFTFLVPAQPGSPGQRAVKRVCVIETWQQAGEPGVHVTEPVVWQSPLNSIIYHIIVSKTYSAPITTRT